MKTTAVKDHSRFTSGWSRTPRTVRSADQRASAKRANGGRLKFQAFTVLVALCAATHAAHGEVLWYGGDLSGIGFINNTHTTPEYGSSVLDDFVVSSPSGWHVTGLFSNNIADPTNLPVADAVWSVRTDVTGGNAGVIVAAGVSPATIALTGRTVSGSGGIAWTEYSVSVDVSLDLDPGTYYMNVSPIASLQVYYVPASNGANATGQFGPGNVVQEDRFPPGEGLNRVVEFQNSRASLGVLGSPRNLDEPQTTSLMLMIVLALFFGRIPAVRNPQRYGQAKHWYIRPHALARVRRDRGRDG
jgi:hypothetical protein